MASRDQSWRLFEDHQTQCALLYRQNFDLFLRTRVLQVFCSHASSNLSFSFNRVCLPMLADFANPVNRLHPSKLMQPQTDRLSTGFVGSRSVARAATRPIIRARSILDVVPLGATLTPAHSSEAGLEKPKANMSPLIRAVDATGAQASLGPMQQCRYPHQASC